MAETNNQHMKDKCGQVYLSLWVFPPNLKCLPTQSYKLVGKPN